MFLLLLTFYLVGSIISATVAFNTATEEDNASLQETFYIVVIAYLLSWSLIFKSVIRNLRNA